MPSRAAEFLRRTVLACLTRTTGKETRTCRVSTARGDRTRAVIQGKVVSWCVAHDADQSAAARARVGCACGRERHPPGRPRTRRLGQAESDRVLEAVAPGRGGRQGSRRRCRPAVVSTGGLALVDVRSRGVYVLLSSTKRTSRPVEDGKPEPPSTWRGEDVYGEGPVIDIESINVEQPRRSPCAGVRRRSQGPRQRRHGERHVPETRAAWKVGHQTGIWTVTFASGTALGGGRRQRSSLTRPAARHTAASRWARW